MAKICPNCGYSAADNEKFCTACGTKLPEAAPAEQPAAVTEPEVKAEPDVKAEPEVKAEPVSCTQPAEQQTAAMTPPPVNYGAVNKGQPKPEIGNQQNYPQYGAPQNNVPQYGAPQNNVPRYGAPQNNAPQYGAPQYGAPQYGAPQYGAPQYGAQAPAPKKKKTGLIIGIIIGVIILIGGIVAIVAVSSGSNSGGNTIINSNVHDLDGSYELTGMKVDGQDYSSLLGYIDDEYYMTISGSDCKLVMGDQTLDINIDQANRKLVSSDTDETVAFSVSGSSITIAVDEVEMTFTRK